MTPNPESKISEGLLKFLGGIQGIVLCISASKTVTYPWLWNTTYKCMISQDIYSFSCLASQMFLYCTIIRNSISMSQHQNKKSETLKLWKTMYNLLFKFHKNELFIAKEIIYFYVLLHKVKLHKISFTSEVSI